MNVLVQKISSWYRRVFKGDELTFLGYIIRTVIYVVNVIDAFFMFLYEKTLISSIENITVM